MAHSFESIQYNVHDVPYPVYEDAFDERVDLEISCVSDTQHLNQEKDSCSGFYSGIPYALSAVEPITVDADKMNHNQRPLLSATFYNSNLFSEHRTQQTTPVCHVPHSESSQSTLDPVANQRLSELIMKKHAKEINSEVEVNGAKSDVLSCEVKGTVFFLQESKCCCRRPPELNSPHVNSEQVQTIQLPTDAPTSCPSSEYKTSPDSWLRRQQARNRLKEWLWKSNHKMLFLACLYLKLTGADKNTRIKN